MVFAQLKSNKACEIISKRLAQERVYLVVKTGAHAKWGEGLATGLPDFFFRLFNGIFI